MYRSFKGAATIHIEHNVQYDKKIHLKITANKVSPTKKNSSVSQVCIAKKKAWLLKKLMLIIEVDFLKCQNELEKSFTLPIRVYNQTFWKVCK